MTRQITKALAANGSAHTINIGAPKDNVPITINTISGSHLNLDFDRAKADYSRQGTDLVFAFPDGNTVTHDSFFVVGSEPLPTFILPDGTPIAAADILTDIDFSPVVGSLVDGKDYAQAHDASLDSPFVLGTGDGSDMLALSGEVNIVSGASISDGDVYGTLVIGDLDSLNGTDASSSGLSLDQIDEILSAFEALDLTGDDCASLKIDVDGLDWLGDDSGDQLIFSGDDIFDGTLLGSDKMLLVKGESADPVDFSSSGWNRHREYHN